MATAAAPVTAPQIALLYQRATRKMLPTLPFVLGGNDLRFKLDGNGYADMLRVSLKGSYHLADACTPAKAQIMHTIVKKFLVDVPGRETPINVSGQILHDVNLASNDFGTFPFAGIPANRVGDDYNTLYASLVDSFPIVVNGSNTFCVNWIVPFHRSVIDHKGALPVGALDDVYLEVTPPNSLAAFLTTANGVGTDVSAFSAVMEVEQISFSAPPSDANVAVGSEGYGFVVKIEDWETPIVATSKPTKVAIPAEDTILGVIHAVTINGVRDSVHVDSLTFKVAETWWTDPTGIPAAQKTVDDAAEHGAPFPEGVFVFDQDLPSTGMAGWIHTDGIKTIETGITVVQGTTLGSDASSILTGLVPLIELPAA